MGFIHDVKKLIKLIPPKRQSLFFSATMPESIRVLASTILTNPEEVQVTPESTTADTVEQEMYFVDASDKKDLLIHLLKDKTIISALVFTRTKHGADKVQRMLEKAHIKAEAIHGNKSQNARQNALRNFKDHTTRVLVATDIAARGIDIDNLNLVINYEIPNIPETYVHRIGRTGRAGLEGKAVSFCDEEEFEYLQDIQKLIAFKIPVITDQPFPGKVLPEIGVKKSKAKKPTSKARKSGRGSVGATNNSASGISESRIPKPTRPESSRPPLSHTPKTDAAPKKYWGK